MAKYYWQKLNIISLIVFNVLILIKKSEHEKWIKYCLNDIVDCKICFEQNEIDRCLTFMDNIDFIDGIDSSVNELFGNRHIKYGSTNNLPIVLKHISDKDKLNQMLANVCPKNICPQNDTSLLQQVKKTVILAARADGIQRCLNSNTERFKQIFNTFTSEIIFWTHFYVNPELVLLKAIQNLNESDNNIGSYAPKFIDSSGFVLIETDAGAPLNEFYDKPFEKRLVIAKNLLLAAEAFSYGMNGMRIYLTDLTGDNIVVDEHTLNVAFIDLDNIIIVDSQPIDPLFGWNETHAHEQIECNGCFAYVPAEICGHHLSDLNIYSVCQLLIEDLYGNVENGFLHSIPRQISLSKPTLMQSILNCYHCSNKIQCNNRLSVIDSIVTEIDTVLEF